MSSSEAVPILPIWGCFDRIVNAATAQEFSDLVHRDVVWVPGGHSWMLPRPQAQADILRYLGQGRTFMEAVTDVGGIWPAVDAMRAAPAGVGDALNSPRGAGRGRLWWSIVGASGPAFRCGGGRVDDPQVRLSRRSRPGRCDRPRSN